MRVGVIGGGLTGLATVHELRSRDVDVVGFEATAEPGGVIRSREVADTVIELGPQRLRAGGIVRSYLEELDLLDELVVADDNLPIYVYGNGSLGEVPFDPRTMLRTDLLSWRGKARLLLEPVTAPAAPGETVAEYFTRKLGHEAYRAGIEPLFGGLYGSDPAEMPVDYALAPIMAQETGRGVLSRLALKRLRSSGGQPPPAVLAGGMQRLPEAIYTANSEAVRLGTPVKRLEVGNSTHQIVTPSSTETVDHVVIATDASAAAEIVGASLPELAGHLDALRYNPLAMVYLEASIDRRGLGFQVRRDEPLQTLGVSWNGVAFDRGDLHTVFLGGMHNPELVEASDDRLISIATEEFEAIMDVPAAGLAVHRLDPGMPAYDRSWSHTRELAPPPGIHLAGNYTSRVGIPGRLRQARRIADELTRS